MSELLSNVSEAKDTLLNLGIFKDIAAGIDTSMHPTRRDAYRVLIAVKESKRIHAGAALNTTTDGTASFKSSLSYKNLFGKGENLTFSQCYGMNKLLDYDFRYVKPLEGNARVKFCFNVNTNRHDARWTKYYVSSKGVSPEVQFKTKYGLHQIIFDAKMREISTPDLASPVAVRLEECGAHLFKSLRHVFTRDSRPDSVFPDGGTHLELSSELATITPGSKTGGQINASGEHVDPSKDTSFQMLLKTRFSAARRLANWLVAEVTFNGGLVQSLTGHRVSILDRFFIGGPLEMRGFDHFQMGPDAPLLLPVAPKLAGAGDLGEGDGPGPATVPIGSPCYWMSGLHLYTPLPGFQNEADSLPSMFRLHGFCLAGATFDKFSNDEGQLTLRSAYERCRESPRVVTGLGLVMRLAGVVRLELNYCWPLLIQPRDRIEPGFQFGIGLVYS